MLTGFTLPINVSIFMACNPGFEQELQSVMWFGAADQFIVLVTAWDVNLINGKTVKIITFYNYLSSDRPAVGDLKMRISIWMNVFKMFKTQNDTFFILFLHACHFKLSTLYGKLACSRSRVAIKHARRKRSYQDARINHI